MSLRAQAICGKGNGSLLGLRRGRCGIEINCLLTVSGLGEAEVLYKVGEYAFLLALWDELQHWDGIPDGFSRRW